MGARPREDGPGEDKGEKVVPVRRDGAIIVSTSGAGVNESGAPAARARRRERLEPPFRDAGLVGRSESTPAESSLGNDLLAVVGEDVRRPGIWHVVDRVKAGAARNVVSGIVAPDQVGTVGAGERIGAASAIDCGGQRHAGRQDEEQCSHRKNC